jgi:hypothetical protein
MPLDDSQSSDGKDGSRKYSEGKPIPIQKHTQSYGGFRFDLAAMVLIRHSVFFIFHA